MSYNNSEKILKSNNTGMASLMKRRQESLAEREKELRIKKEAKEKEKRKGKYKPLPRRSKKTLQPDSDSGSDLESYDRLLKKIDGMNHEEMINDKDYKRYLKMHDQFLRERKE